MKNPWFTLIILLVIPLFGCQSETSGTETPIVSTIANLPPQADSTSLITLVRNPGFFEGNYLRLSGQYRPIPLLVCSEEGQFSPATWALVDGEIEVPAAGFDGVLRRLADPGLDLIVEGRWQHWEGPVGCGRRAPITEIWYFEVTNIVSPNPLTAGQVGEGIASLPIEPTPVTAGDSTGLTPIVTTPSIVVPTASATSPPTSTPRPTTAPTNTPQETAFIAPATRSTTATSTPTPSVTPQQRGATTLTATSTRTPTGTPVTITPDGSPTATSDATSEPIDFDDIVKQTLAVDGINRWRFQGDPGDIVFISVSPVQSLDVSIELLDPNGNSLVSRNQRASGQVENIDQQSLNMSGNYDILVRSEANSNGDYALVLQTDDTQPFILFQGNMNYGNSRTNSVPIDSDDLWNFSGTSGDVVTIRAVASGSSDLVLYLIDPDLVYVEEVDDNSTYGPPDDEEIIDQYTLQKTGLFTIGVGEYDYQPFGYTLTLQKQ